MELQRTVGLHKHFTTHLRLEEEVENKKMNKWSTTTLFWKVFADWDVGCLLASRTNSHLIEHLCVPSLWWVITNILMLEEERKGLWYKNDFFWHKTATELLTDTWLKLLNKTRVTLNLAASHETQFHWGCLFLMADVIFMFVGFVLLSG